MADEIQYLKDPQRIIAKDQQLEESATPGAETEGNIMTPEDRQETAPITISAPDGSGVVHAGGEAEDINRQTILDQPDNSGRNTPSYVELTRFAPWEYHLESGLYEFNDEFYAIYGTSETQEGRFMSFDAYIMEFVHPDDAWMIEAETARARSFPGRHYSGQVEHRIVRRDGEVRTIIARSNIVKDDAGKIKRCFGANQDITEQKAMEEDLWISRKKLAQAVELARLGPWKYNLAENLFEFGDEFYAIYGTNAAREGRFMAPEVYTREFLHPDDAWIVEAEIKKAFACTGQNYTRRLEHRIIRRDGVVRTIIVLINITRDADDKIVSFFGVNQDITEQKAMEEDRWINREKLSLAAELARLGPWEYNLAENLFEFGDDFYAIYGTDSAREGFFMAPEVYVREFVHPDDARMVEAGMNKMHAYTGSYSKQFEHRIIRRDGEVRTINVRVNVTRDAAGEMIKCYGVNQDITELKQAEEALRKKAAEIQHLAFTDSLTGLPNRMYITNHLAEEMEKARREKTSVVLLFIDLDELKMVNDSFGHTYGDALIMVAGNRIVEQAGSEAFVGRIGGDEFMVILPENNNRQAISSIIDGIIAGLCQTVDILGVNFHISASAGAAVYPDDGETPEEIFKNADNAMYAAKKAGKNCWRFYGKSMQVEAYKKVLLTSSLHHALDHGELLLHYQPQVSVNSGAVVGFEALLRWNSAEYGLISPLRFIPLAEKCGIIHSIGTWVLREACRFARGLADQGWEHISVAVNVSPYQLGSDCFVDVVRGSLSEFGVLPDQLKLEITETAFIASLEESILKFKQLQAIGVRLALDDFGTGYSSLTYLQHLPVQTLKIDKSFIDMISVAGTNRAIIGNVVNMAHIMELTVVAEGVETQEQFDYLAGCGCDVIQGYLFSRPVPEEDAVRYLSDDQAALRLPSSKQYS